MEIMKSPSPSRTFDERERRRLPRMALSSEIFRVDSSGKLYPIVDLSEGGMGVRVIDREDLAVLPVGARVKGTLSLHGEKIALAVQVRHISHDLIGFQFESLPDSARKTLDRYLSPARIARDMKPVPPPESEGNAIWYHGPSGTELVIWRGPDGQFTRFSLCVLGVFVQYETSRGVSTGTPDFSGRVMEDAGMMRFETMMLSADAAPDPKKLDVAKTLLVSSNIPEELKRFCLRKLGT